MTASTRLSVLAFLTAVLATISPTIQPAAIPPSAPTSAPRFYFGQSGDLGLNTKESQLRDGALAAFRQVNEQGGVFGVLLDLISYDDHGDASLTVINTQSFIDQKVIGCMGYLALAGITDSMPMLENAGIPMLAPGTGARSLRLPVNRYVLHTRASLDEEAHAWVSYCISRGLLAFSVFYQDDEDGVAGLESILLALGNNGLRPLAISKLIPGENVTLAGLLYSGNATLTIPPQVIAIYAPEAPATAFIKLAKAQWPTSLLYLSFHFGQQGFLDTLVAAGVNQSYANDMFITSVFPIPVPENILPTIPPNWRASRSSVLREYVTATNVTCPSCRLSFSRLEGFIAGRMVASILTHMLPFNYSSALFRPYLDRQGVNASGVSLDDDASLRAWRELLIDTIYRESMFDVAGLKLGPYFENVTCDPSNPDCVQTSSAPCSQGMSHVYLAQPILSNISYTELTDWRRQSPSCNFYSLPPPGQLPLVFGQSGLLSGPAGGLATDMRNGILAAFAEANESPSRGVRGRKLLLMSLDDRYSADQALVNAQHFINNQSLVAVVGAVGDDPTQVVTPVYSNASLPLIGTNCGARFVRNSWVIVVRALYDDEAAGMVNFALSRNLTKISIFRQLAAFGNSGFDAVNLALAYNKMQMHSEAGYSRGTLPSWPAIFTNLTKGGVPDVVILFSSITNSQKLITQAFNDSAWSNTIFIAASISDIDRLQTSLTSQILASGRVLGSAVVPATRTGAYFQEYLAALRLIDSRLFQFSAPFAPTLASLEGYLIGKLVVSGLARVTEFTGTAMLADLVTSHALTVSGFKLGPYNTECSMGLRSTYVVRLENSTTSPMTQLFEWSASSSNTFIPNCGALSVYNTSFACPEGYDKKYVNNATFDSVCKLCLSPYGCTLPEHVPNRSLRSAMLALNIIGFLIAVAFVAIIVYYRHTTTIRAASPPFCFLILVGAMCGYIFVFIQYPAMPTPASCMGQVYLLNTASCLLFASLFAKVFRVNRIFQPREKESFRVLAIPNLALFGGVGAMWVIEMIYTAIWHAVSPLVPVHASTPTSQYWTCDSEEPLFGIVDIIGNGLFLLYGVMLSVQSRRVPTLFNEAKFVAATMYNTFILGAISVLLGYEVATNDDQLYLFKSLGIFFVITVDLALLIASKFPSLYGEVQKGIIPQYKKDSSSNTSGTKVTSPSAQKSEVSRTEPQSSTGIELSPRAEAKPRSGGSVMARMESEVASLRRVEVVAVPSPVTASSTDKPQTTAPSPAEASSTVPPPVAASATDKPQTTEPAPAEASSSTTDKPQTTEPSTPEA